MMRFSAKQHLKLGIAVGSLLLAMGCAKPPTQEMADAENAVNAAIQSGAQQYASTELNQAQEALADAKAKMESKDYKGAKMSALDAKAKGDAAKTAVEPNKKAAMAQALERINSMKTAIETVQGDAGKVKGKNAAAVKAQLAALQDQYKAIQADYDGGNYASALGKMGDAEAKYNELKAAIEAAKPSAAAKK